MRNAPAALRLVALDLRPTQGNVSTSPSYTTHTKVAEKGTVPTAAGATAGVARETEATVLE